MREKWTRYGVERLLFLMCTGTLDFLDHILSSRYEIMSDSYENILESAYKRNIIGEFLYFKLQGIGGFRNVLADEYLTLSDNEVFSNFLIMVEIIDMVIEDFENTIKNM